jgi:hypothetical protein
MTTAPSTAIASLLSTLLVGGLACTSPAPPGGGPSTPTQEPPAATSPGAPMTPVPPGTTADPATEPTAEPIAPAAPIADALQRVPEAIAALYVFALSDDRNELTIDPAPAPSRRARDIRGGFSAKDSEKGGKIITLAGGPFLHGGWVRASFRQRVAAPERLEDLRRAGYDVDVVRDLLVVDGQADPHPTLFAFSHDAGKLGIVGVCSDVTIIDFGVPSPPSRPIAVRKPVVYLYPPATTRVSVRLELEGELVALYPPMRDGGWTVTASPSGELHDEATGRHHRYLFWEGTSAGWELDPEKAHLVRGDEAAPFMERVCERYALTDAECGDFVTYWLPELAKNPYSVVQLVDEDDYARYARLHVTPEPDTVIRPFMIFRRSETPVPVGAPALPRRERRGFTVVEWGGASLDEASEPSLR